MNGEEKTLPSCIAQVYFGLASGKFIHRHLGEFFGIAFFFALIVSYFIFIQRHDFGCLIEVCSLCSPSFCPPSDAGDGLLETHGIPTGFCGGGPRFFPGRWQRFFQMQIHRYVFTVFKNSTDITWTSIFIVELVVHLEFLISSPGLLVRPVLRNCSFCGARGVEG